ncbi:hypothetical protein [Novosphingobium capsulatum]|uniref:hypothetical protein n=1 Tax=Novosphingobium capsulatum TaxID=13688 RepID=UPI000A90C9DE|nr:hypothetical protein [Novosphingobium capsulatum]WQD92577.1 hypothetical protein U0041_16540 [Novosphingobium capsulatum]
MKRFRKILRACLIPALRALGAAAMCYWLIWLDPTDGQFLVLFALAVSGWLWSICRSKL